MPFKAIDVTGERYGRLVAVRRAESRGRRTFWLFRCDCGAEVETGLGAVRYGDTRSCGCLNIERIKERSTRHGMHGTPTYVVWNSMKARCENPLNKKFSDYGGRGIKVCDRWSKSFDAFLADMGVRPVGTTIDRTDNNAGYEPANCRWAGRSVQRINQRNSELLSFRGQLCTAVQIAEQTGLPVANLRYRIRKKGLSPDEAVAILSRGKWRRV